MLISRLTQPRPSRTLSHASTEEERPLDGFIPNNRTSGATSGKSIRDLVAAGADHTKLLKALDHTLAKAKLAPLSQIHANKLERFCQNIPKVDLHRHLEGAITPEALISVAKKHNVELPTYDADKLRPMLSITPQDAEGADEDGLKVFLSKFDLIGKIFKNPDVIEDITYHTTKDCADDNLKYAELRFSPAYMAKTYGLDLEQTTEAVVRGMEKASEQFNIPVGLIMIVERQMGVDKAWEVEALAAKYADQGVVALDLANNEYDFPPGPYKEVFQKAKQDGLKVTVHAGEVPIHHADPSVGGAFNVKTAILELGADRIGHGVKAIEDPEVEKLLVERQIPLELCPTSNVQTQAVPSMEQHPLPHFQKIGAKVTVNNDDPAVSGITLSDDYKNIAQTFGFSITDLRGFVDNGVDAAFTTDGVKGDVRSEIAQGFASAERDLLDSLSLSQLKDLALSGAGSEKDRSAIQNEFANLTEWILGS
jgi:adenosine deaminase